MSPFHQFIYCVLSVSEKIQYLSTKLKHFHLIVDNHVFIVRAKIIELFFYNTESDIEHFFNHLIPF